MSMKGYSIASWTYIDEYVFGGKKRKKAKKLSSKARRLKIKKETLNEYKMGMCDVYKEQ